MRFAKILLLLSPAGLVAGFGGCGVSLADSGSGVGGSHTSSTIVASAETSGSAGVGGGADAGGSGIGGLCVDSAQCAPGLSCLTAGANDPVFGGGAPGGFCTQVCSADVDCAGMGGVCYSAVSGQPGRCTLPCTIAPPVTDAGADAGGDAGTDADAGAPKCLGRDDVRCTKVAEGVDDCLPTCSSDSQCLGRVCDPRSAVCVDPPATPGAPTGTPCDASALSDGGASNPCAGVCILFDPGYGMCSQPCVLGGASDDECGGPMNGICAFHPDPNEDGDTGYCTNACTTPADCNNPIFGCFGVPSLTQGSGKGYCFAATTCPNGDQDCAKTPGYVCTETLSGPQCLDPMFLPPPPDGGVPEGGTDAGTSDGGADGADEGDSGASDAATADDGATGP